MSYSRFGFRLFQMDVRPATILLITKPRVVQSTPTTSSTLQYGNTETNDWNQNKCQQYKCSLDRKIPPIAHYNKGMSNKQISQLSDIITSKLQFFGEISDTFGNKHRVLTNGGQITFWQIKLMLASLCRDSVGLAFIVFLQKRIKLPYSLRRSC